MLTLVHECWTELPPGEYRLTAKLRNTSMGEGGELSQDWVVPPATE